MLGLPYLDTGVLYRAVGRRVLDRHGDPTDRATAEREARALTEADLARPDLRGPEADAAAASVAAVPGVRAALLDFQRAFARERGAVLDGRDIGTVIFPDAPVKLFVVASLAVRARRRWLELRAKGMEVGIEEIERSMHARDALDAARAAAPLRPAPDAAVLDTTDLGPEAAFLAALRVVKEKLPLGATFGML